MLRFVKKISEICHSQIFSTLFTSPLNNLYYLKANITIAFKVLLGIFIHYIYFKISRYVYQYIGEKTICKKLICNFILLQKKMSDTQN